MCRINKRKYKIISIVLVLIMLSGLFIHSILLWSLNRVLPPESLAYTSSYNIEDIGLRLALRRIAEIITGVCSAVYLIGNIIMIYSFIKRSFAIAFYRLSLPFIITLPAMFVVTYPFSIADEAFSGDYLFPVWSTMVITGLFFLIVLSANLIKCCKKYILNKVSYENK